MIDWNGNGKIDPADIAISLALDSAAQEQEEGEYEETEPAAPAKAQGKVKRHWLLDLFRKK